jgi:hypothetical protein
MLVLAVGLAAACTGANPAFVTGPAEPPDGAPADAPAGDTRPADGFAADLPPDAFVPPAGCGAGMADVTGIDNADGVQVDSDGTVYFLTDDTIHSYVGRVRVGQAPELRWVRVDDSPTTWGLALDSARKRIYVLVVDGPGALVAFDDIGGTPTGSQFVRGINNGNDVVVAGDGTVFYTQQGNRHVYRVPPQGGTPVQVTSLPLGAAAMNQAPAALAVAPDGNLIVGLENGGPLYKITLGGGVETGRAPVGGWMGWANGLTYDRRQRLYIASYHDTQARSVVRLEADGSTSTITAGGRFSSIAFGRGALDCRDLYVAQPFGPMRRVRVGDSL